MDALLGWTSVILLYAGSESRRAPNLLRGCAERRKDERRHSEDAASPSAVDELAHAEVGQRDLHPYTNACLLYFTYILTVPLRISSLIVIVYLTLRLVHSS